MPADHLNPGDAPADRLGNGHGGVAHFEVRDAPLDSSPYEAVWFGTKLNRRRPVLVRNPDGRVPLGELDLATFLDHVLLGSDLYAGPTSPGRGLTDAQLTTVGRLLRALAASGPPPSVEAWETDAQQHGDVRVVAPARFSAALYRLRDDLPWTTDVRKAQAARAEQRHGQNMLRVGLGAVVLTALVGFVASLATLVGTFGWLGTTPAERSVVESRATREAGLVGAERVARAALLGGIGPQITRARKGVRLGPRDRRTLREAVLVYRTSAGPRARRGAEDLKRVLERRYPEQQDVDERVSGLALP